MVMVKMVMEKLLTFFPTKSMSTLCLQSRHYDVRFSHSVPLYAGPGRGLSRKPGGRGPEQGSLSILRSLLLISDVLYLPQLPGVGGGGHCLFEGRYPKQNYRPPGSVLPQPSLTVFTGLQPPVFEASKESLLLLLLLPRLAPSGHHFQLS